MNDMETRLSCLQLAVGFVPVGATLTASTEEVVKCAASFYGFICNQVAPDTAEQPKG